MQKKSTYLSITHINCDWNLGLWCKQLGMLCFSFGIVALANDNDKKKMESLGECDFEGQKIRVSVHMAKGM